MTAKRFSTNIAKSGTGIIIPIPFNPNEVWGIKQRHHITGYVNGYKVRGSVLNEGDQYFLQMGAAWCRETELESGKNVDVILAPEGPQTEQLAPDILGALDAEPQARAFFESLATFYRKAYIKWLDGARRRPEIREARIMEMIKLLKAGKKQK